MKIVEMAGRLRYRAGIMTANSFLADLLPPVIAVGGRAASRRSVGTAIFGAMLEAPVIGIFLIPVLYVVFQTLREKIKGAGKKKKALKLA